jgi:hypothetical protein
MEEEKKVCQRLADQVFQGFDFIKGSFFFNEIPMKFHEKEGFH